MLAAKTLSSKFGDCYHLLAMHYVAVAELEEFFASREAADS
jgi:hypothetical protein